MSHISHSNMSCLQAMLTNESCQTLCTCMSLVKSEKRLSHVQCTNTWIRLVTHMYGCSGPAAASPGNVKEYVYDIWHMTVKGNVNEWVYDIWHVTIKGSTVIHYFMSLVVKWWMYDKGSLRYVRGSHTTHGIRHIAYDTLHTTYCIRHITYDTLLDVLVCQR